MPCLRNVKKWLTSRRLAFKYLTEEEYREQAAAETTRALEELRQACRRPDFPSWLVMSRLQAPKNEQALFLTPPVKGKEGLCECCMDQAQETHADRAQEAHAED
ncbi:Transmembrane protein 194B [Myotis brandtii]|uniref:Transmembrane protein 194B n=1 Tax=Myotis brandtii TaxID=109478 RepID=S7PL48_MYOBR|nr:Transmembrane protein 194B [Myotis brandtii]